MGSRVDEIRKRIEKRNRLKERSSRGSVAGKIAETEELHGFDPFPSYETSPDEGRTPVFSKELLLFKVLFAACLFLGVAILFRNGGESTAPVKAFVQKTMQKEFEFASVSGWYEEKFGKPLTLLPRQDDKNDSKLTPANQDAALPASGKILEEFRDDGQKITIETGKDAAVEAMMGGRINFIGEKEGFGKTVIIQHADRSESWYGNLERVDVGLYEFVEKGKHIGKSAESNEREKGSFYFAIKKGNDFVDPIQVIRFE
ncbi:M23 family metallopeptidase [Bacillus massilinigeriensis]|uniref:M23 family metallopeptidase n=1 Tax=Bacillus mediterraneensis TaxID=1805474 RepID=UPI0008F92FC7|nr:M23 family metallopeptidase [Bacillus mediterraneensis]